ncbi:hypothetical protein Leryth_018171 [Lithospermum erythrorhizon]|nr:hypothetical protein Leryth_018171 [Lithospermum erythrorhizon]
MATSGGGFHQGDPSAAPGTTILPPWLSNSRAATNVRSSSPSVTLSLSPTTIQSAPGIGWFHPESAIGNVPSHVMAASPYAEVPMIPELVECCKELEEIHRAWTTHKKEAAWRLRRVELQLESEKASRKREKLEEIEAKISALKEEQKVALDKIEADYKEQLASLRRDAESKDQKLAEQWAAKHVRLTKFLEQMGCRSALSDPSGR